MDHIAQRVVNELEWSSSIPDIKAMVLRALSEAVAAEREACAKLVHDRLGADGYGVAQMIRNRATP